MRVGNTVGFTELHRNLRGTPQGKAHDAGKHLRFTEAKGLYLHGSVSRKGIFDRFGKYAARRAKKQQGAGQHVWKAIANQHGEEVANRIFKNVLHYEGADHRTSVTLGDLDRIKQALPKEVESAELEQVKQGAIRLAAADKPQGPELDQFFADNLDVLSSKEFNKTFCAVTSAEEFRTIQAFAYYDRLVSNGDSYMQHDFDKFLEAIGVDRKTIMQQDHLTNGNESAKLAQVTDGGVLREETKQWMAEKLFARNFEQGAEFQLNLNSDRGLQQFGDKFQRFQGTGDEKMEMLRAQYHRITHPDVPDIATKTAKAVAEMQGQPTDGIGAAVDQEYEVGIPERQFQLRQRQTSIRNRRLVRKYLPGTGRFNKLAEARSWDPKHLMSPERKYISDRLQGLAELKAQDGVAVDEKWVGNQVKVMLKELEEPRGTPDKPTLPEMRRQTQAAARSVMEALTDPGSISLQERTRRVLDFQSQAAEFSKARFSYGSGVMAGPGPDDVEDDYRLFLLEAAKGAGNLEHVDPLAGTSQLLHAAEFARKDPRMSQLGFGGGDGSMLDGLLAAYHAILGAAANQLQLRKGKPDLGRAFGKQSDQASAMVSDYAKKPDPSKLQRLGIPGDELPSAVGVLVEFGLERESSRDRVDSDASEFEYVSETNMKN